MYSHRMEIAGELDGLARLGHALSDSTRAGVLLALAEEPSYPADLAVRLGVSRQALSNHLACLRGCGLVVACPEGRRSRYELADVRIAAVLAQLRGLVTVVDPECAGGSRDHAGRNEDAGARL